MNISDLKALSKSMYKNCKDWFESLALTQQQQIIQQLGNFPEPEMEHDFGINGPMWHWWMLAIMPLDPRIQLAMIAMTSYKERLQGLDKVLTYMKHKRGSQWLAVVACIGIVVLPVVFSYSWIRSWLMKRCREDLFKAKLYCEHGVFAWEMFLISQDGNNELNVEQCKCLQKCTQYELCSVVKLWYGYPGRIEPGHNKTY